MIIGNFAYDSEDDTYCGDIKTLTLRPHNVALRPNEKTGAREPGYRITHEDAAGLTAFGADWKRESEKGRPFLSIVFEAPALPGPLNAALFPSDVDATAQLVWQRP